MKISLNTTNSLMFRTKMIDMLSRDEFINVINKVGNSTQKALLGTDNTDWNKQVYQTAFGTDNNMSFSGQVVKNMPYRLSVGYYNQQGILKTDKVERYTANLSLAPSFFNGFLKLTLNVKGSYNKNRFADQGAIWGAATFNPTLPIYSGNTAYGGYNEALDSSGLPVNGGVRNQLGVINQYDSRSTVKCLIGNFDIDYKMHFLPDLKFHATLGLDNAEGKGTVYIPAEAASNYSTSGRDYSYGPQKNKNK